MSVQKSKKEQVWCGNSQAPCQIAADVRREVEGIKDAVRKAVIIGAAIGAAGGSAAVDLLRAFLF